MKFTKWESESVQTELFIWNDTKTVKVSDTYLVVYRFCSVSLIFYKFSKFYLVMSSTTSPLMGSTLPVTNKTIALVEQNYKILEKQTYEFAKKCDESTYTNCDTNISSNISQNLNKLSNQVKRIKISKVC